MSTWIPVWSGPHPQIHSRSTSHSLSPVPKLGIPMYPLVGLIFTTSVLDSHPALTNTARMRELICCAPVISLLAARLKYALFRAVERLQKLTQRKKDRPTIQGGTVCPEPLPRTCGQNGHAHFCSADVIILQPRPTKTGDRQTLYEERNSHGRNRPKRPQATPA